MTEAGGSAVGMLLREFAARRAVNERYSLRSFARKLRVSPGLLSEILTGKRSLTPDMAARFAEQLELPENARTQLLTAVQGARGNAPGRRRKGTPGPAYELLSSEYYEVIAEWYHYAILSLLEIKSFRSDPKWIAEQLGISAIEVRAAIARMKALGMLQEDASGKLSEPKDNITTTTDVPSTAIRRFHRGMIQKSADALDHVELGLRDIASITMSINSAQLPKAKELSAKFRRELCALLEQGPRDAVYALNVQLIPLTKGPGG